MRRLGYAVFTEEGGVREYDTRTCGHCGCVIFVKPGTGGTVYLLPRRSPLESYLEEMGAHCRMCNTPVCLACHADGRCTPIEKWLEQQEARGRLLRSVGG